MKSARLLLLVVAVACGAGSTEPTATVNGTYTLRTINGAALPQNIYADPDQSLAILSGTLTLNANNTYSLVEQERIIIGGQTTQDEYTEQGTYVQTGSNLELTVSQSGVPIKHQMTWSADKITWTDVFINQSSTYVFTR